MSVFGEWFGSGLKMKRWLFLVLLGTVTLSYSIAKILTNKEIGLYALVIYALMFILGFAAIITGFVMAQRRMLQAIAEYSANQNVRNLNIKKLLFDKKMLDRNIKVVAIGDGAGLSTVLKSLKIFSYNVNAIVSVIGKNNKYTGSTIDVTGIKKAMVALAKKENELKTFMNYKNVEGDFSGKNSGDMFMESLINLHHGNISEAIAHMSKILAIEGNVVPATLDQIDLGAILNDGTRVVTKTDLLNKIKERNSPIDKLFLIPERCEPAPEVIRSIKEADVIIIGPGSLYMGILPILLIREITDAIKKSKANKIFISNTMTEAGQTDNFSVADHIHVIEEHVGKGLFDYCIVSDSDIMPEYIGRYNQNGSDVVDIDKHILKNMNLEVIIDDLSVVDETNSIHHDPVKLANILVKIICDNMDMKDNQATLNYYTMKSKIDKTKKKKKKNILFKNMKLIMPTKKKKDRK